MAETILQDGIAWQQFRRLVTSQGGEVSVVDKPALLPQAPLVETVAAERSGYLLGIDAREVGETSVELGAGRARKEDPIDHAVGIVIHHKVGDHIGKGEGLFTIHANDLSKMVAARKRLLAAHQWSDHPVEPLPLFYGIVE